MILLACQIGLLSHELFSLFLRAHPQDGFFAFRRGLIDHEDGLHRLPIPMLHHANPARGLIVEFLQVFRVARARVLLEPGPDVVALKARGVLRPAAFRLIRRHPQQFALIARIVAVGPSRKRIAVPGIAGEIFLDDFPFHEIIAEVGAMADF